VILGIVGFVRKTTNHVSAVSAGDGTFASQSFKFLSSFLRLSRGSAGTFVDHKDRLMPALSCINFASSVPFER